MTIEARKPTTPFDFSRAVTQLFQTDGGKAFAWRLVFWVATGITVTMLVTLPFILPFYGELMEFNWRNMQAAMGGNTPPDPAPLLGIMAKMAPAYLLMMLGLWVSVAMGEAALHRKVLKQTENPRRPVRFGKDEIRVMIAQLGVWVTAFGVYIFGALILGIISGIVGVASAALAVVIMIVGIIFLLCMLIYIPVRLAPASALSIDRGQQHLMAGRYVSKFRFWQLFSAYLVTFIGGYILIYLVMSIAVGIVTGDMGFMMSLSGLGSENPAAVFDAAAARFKNPLVMLIGVLSVVFYSIAAALWYLSMSGVGAYAVQWWRDDNPVSQFE